MITSLSSSSSSSSSPLPSNIHDNIHYGLDPHTGTHDMIIRNNVVHDNGSIGIICSLDCYNIIFVRNNTVSHEDRGIVISESHNNEVNNNIVSTSGTGIDLDQDSSENMIHDNVIKDIADPAAALDIEDGAETENTLYSNILINSSNGQRISLDQVVGVEDEDDDDDTGNSN